MSDLETPAFQVVDRRSAAQPPASAPPAQPVAADTSGTDPGAASAAPPSMPSARPAAQERESASASQSDATAASQSDATAQFEQDIDSGDDIQMPDPAALLPYVALQMDVKQLAGTLLGVFDAQAWRALGLVASPITGQTEKNLPDAQIAIDCVQFLLGKVDSSLSEPERREMHRRLNDLRMNYLAKLREG